MKHRSFTTHSVSTWLAAASLLIAGAASAQDCVSFMGIDHCPVGKSTVQAGRDGVTVSNNGDGAGVSSRFAPTALWNSHTEIAGGMQQRTVLSSISGGEATSKLYLEPGSDGLHLRSVFTGASENPTYSVLIYNKGILQGSYGNMDGRETTGLTKRAPNVAQNDIILDPIDEWFEIYWWLHFFISRSGGCNWGISMPAEAAFLLPDGSKVIGDEIRFTEDVTGSGHYPYLGFEAIDTVSTAPSLRITDELAESAR